MVNKNDKPLLFNVKLNWIGDTVGLLSSTSVSEELQVAAPIEFGGTEKLWTPEHFFLNAISSCFMTTYLSFSKKMGFEISDFSCEAVGQIEIVEGRYRFTHINLFPKVRIASEDIREKAEKAIEKAHKYCLISNSINAEVFYLSQVLVETEQAQS
jgi:peroxiredoxin-like protein